MYFHVKIYFEGRTSACRFHYKMLKNCVFQIKFHRIWCTSKWSYFSAAFCLTWHYIIFTFVFMMDLNVDVSYLLYDVSYIWNKMFLAIYSLITDMINCDFISLKFLKNKIYELPLEGIYPLCCHIWDYKMSKNRFFKFISKDACNKDLWNRVYLWNKMSNV